MCYCGEKSVIVMSWKPRSFGRRFHGCCKYWVCVNIKLMKTYNFIFSLFSVGFHMLIERNVQSVQVGASCNFFEWFDPPTCSYSLEIGRKVMERINRLEHELELSKQREKKSVQHFQVELARLRCERTKLQRLLLLSWMLILIAFFSYYAHSSDGDKWNQQQFVHSQLRENKSRLKARKDESNLKQTMNRMILKL